MWIRRRVSKCVASIAIGCVLWLAAAIAIRAVDLESWKGSTAVLLITMFLLLMSAPILVVIVKHIAGVRWADLYIATVWMTTAALLLDGLAIAFCPSIYGVDRASLSTAAALLLFGAGVTQLAGLCITHFANRNFSRKERDEMS